MRRLLLLCALFLLFSGCISETEYSDKEPEVLLSSSVYDEDEDGVTDFYHYTFEEEEYEEYSIQREIYVYPDNTLSTFNFNLLDDLEVVNSLTLFDDYSGQLRSGFEDCTKKLGIGTTKCANIEHCASKCAETSTCKKLAEDYPEFIGYLILSLDQDNSERKSLTNSINTALWDYTSLSASDKQTLFEDLNSLYLLGSSTINGPLFTDEKIGICSNTLSYYSYRELFSILGTKTLTQGNYKYLILLKISKEEGDTQEYKDFFVKEEIAPSFEEDSLFLVQKATVEEEIIEWNPIRADKNKEILFYTFESTEAPSPELWETPQYKSSTINLLILQPSFALFSLFLPISNYHIALSLSIILPIIILLIIINLVFLSYNVMKAQVEKKTLYKAIKDYVGSPSLKWKKDLVFGSLLFVIGIGASFFAEPVPDKTLELFNLVVNIFNDSLALLSVFFLIVGALFLFLSVDSMIKAILLKYSYAGVLKREKEAVLDEIGELKEKHKLLKDTMEEHKKQGFDVGEAYNVYISISEEKLSKLSDKDIEKEASFVEQSLYKIENALSLMKERKENADKNWSSWSASIAELFNKGEEIHLSTINFIPYSLRTWAANRFILEHPELGVIFEGETLRKKKVAPEELIEGALKSGYILDALVIKEGKPVVSSVSSCNKTVMEGLLVKLSSYLKTFLKKSEQKDYKYVMGISNNIVFALVKRGELESLIICPTDKFKEGFEQWKGVLDTIH